MKLTKFGSGSARGFGKNARPSVVLVKIGEYFWATANESNPVWSNLNFWWYDNAHAVQATQLPLSTTNVKVLADSAIPFVELSAASWVQPASINSGTTGIIFYSQAPYSITCSITAISPAVALFTGGAVYNLPG